MIPDLKMADFVPAPDRAAWLQLRSTGLGGSDIAAAAGLNPYKSPYALWVEKTERLSDAVESEAMEWGNRLESVVLSKWAEQHPSLELSRPPLGVWRHVEHDFMLATPDAFALDAGEPVGLIEAKTAGLRSAHQWADGIPDHYELQTRWYLACLGLPRAWVAVLIGGQQWREFEIVRDLEIEERIVELASGFWQLVADRTPPEVDGTESTSDALKRLFATDDGGSIELPIDGAALLNEARAARQAVKDAEARQAAADNQIKALLGDHAVATIDGRVAATWKTFDKKSLDQKALRAALPDVAAQFTVESSYRTLSIKDMK